MNPVVSTEISDFLSDCHSNSSLLPNTVSSPAHVLFPNAVRANAVLFENVYRRHSMEPAVYYALKANKSNTLLRAGLQQTRHVEVSSLFELIEALEGGVPWCGHPGFGPD